MRYQFFGVAVTGIAATALVILSCSCGFAADVVTLRCDYVNSFDVIDGKMKIRREKEEGGVTYEVHPDRILEVDGTERDLKAKDIFMSLNTISFTSMYLMPLEAEDISINLKTREFSEKVRQPPNWDTRIIVYGTCTVANP